MMSNNQQKIEYILEEINKIGIELKDIVDYHNNQKHRKSIISGIQSNKSWASDDEEDEKLYFIENNGIEDKSIEDKGIEDKSIEEEPKVNILEMISKSFNEINNISNEIIQKRINVYNKDDFKNCINKKINECIKGWDCKNPNCKRFYHIYPEAHCFHTYNGTLCENVIQCDKIHIQRCFKEIDHFKNGKLIKAINCPNKYKNCKYIHKYNLKTEKAKENFDNTMEEYKKKKYKQFFN